MNSRELRVCQGHSGLRAYTRKCSNPAVRETDPLPVPHLSVRAGQGPERGASNVGTSEATRWALAIRETGTTYQEHAAEEKGERRAGPSLKRVGQWASGAANQRDLTPLPACP